jgi:hypothetical protein
MDVLDTCGIQTPLRQSPQTIEQAVAAAREIGNPNRQSVCAISRPSDVRHIVTLVGRFKFDPTHEIWYGNS